MNVLKAAINGINNPHYCDTFIYKLVMPTVGGGSAIYQIREWLPDWAAAGIEVAFGLPWMEWFGGIAVILLIIERIMVIRLHHVRTKNAKDKCN